MAFSKSGYDNVAIGYNAFRGGSSNGAAGGASADNIGYQNVAVGVDAMKVAKSARQNVVIGWKAGDALAGNSGSPNISSFNTLIGSQAGGAMNTSSWSVHIGYNAGDTSTGGNNNTIIGAGADVNAATRKHTIAIGRNAIVTADNTMQIGAATGDPKLNTVNVGDVSASVVNAGTFTQGSDMRFKNFIFPLESVYGLSFINKLKPVTYNLISNGKNSIGLIAQDVEEVDASSYFTGSFINENKGANK